MKKYILDEMNLDEKDNKAIAELEDFNNLLIDARKEKQKHQGFLENEANQKFRNQTMAELHECDSNINKAHLEYSKRLSFLRRNIQKDKLGLLEALFDMEHKLDIVFISVHYMWYLDKPIAS